MILSKETQQGQESVSDEHSTAPSTDNAKPAIKTFYSEHYPQKEHSPRLSDFSLVYLNNQVQLGVISRKFFSKGDVVADLDGEVVTDIRQHTVQISEKFHLFDPYFSGYISHSCEPNVRLIGDKKQLIAIRDIIPEECLTLDYNDTEDELFKPFNCQCGSSSCIGWIEGRNAPGSNKK